MARNCGVKVVLSIALTILLSGCLGFGHAYWPDQARLSRTPMLQQVWDKDYVHEQRVEGVGPVRFYFRAEDVVHKKNIVFDDGTNYWIRITAFTKGRKSFAANYNIPGEGVTPPMIYASDVAYIDMGDGRKVYAAPKIFHGDTENPDIPGKEYLNSPANLNSDEIHSRPRNNSLPAYRSVYLRFPVRPPVVGTAWVVHLDSVKLDNKIVKLSEYSFYLYKGRDEYYRFKGAW